MARIHLLPIVIAIASTGASAGTVSFLNPSDSIVPNELWLPGLFQRGTYEIWITETTNDSFTSIDLVIGSKDLLLPLDGWVFADSFLRDLTSASVTDEVDQLLVDNELRIRGANLLGDRIPVPIMIGTLTVDTSIADFGFYEIFVDHILETDGISRIGFADLPDDLLFGLTTVFVGVPEPTTLALLSLGTLMILGHRRRRRTP